VLKELAAGLLGRVVGLALFGVGFWALAKGFIDSSVPIAILGGALMLGGMWAMAHFRRLQE
jgi:hypothetical protein